MALETRTLERITNVYSGPDHDLVVDLLSMYSGPEPGRVVWDILELSKGDAGMVGQFLQAAQIDYRDVLYWAEYFKTDPLLQNGDPKQMVDEVLKKWGGKK